MTATRLVLTILLLSLPACGSRGGITPVRTPFNKGVYHFAQGNYEEAIAEYREAVEEDATDHRARFNLAMALEARANEIDSTHENRRSALWGEAREHYQTILQEEPDHLRACVNLAAHDFENGSREKAFARLRAAIERHRREALPRVALAAHLLRESRKGETPALPPLLEARALLDEALELNPASAEANMLLGDTLVQIAEVIPEDREALRELAREAYERVLQRAPSDVATLLALARLEIGEPDYPAAAVWLERVLHIHPDHFEAHWLLFGVREAEGDLESATRHLWRARELDSNPHPRVSAGEYRRRLVDLYDRLSARETGSPDAAEK